MAVRYLHFSNSGSGLPRMRSMYLYLSTTSRIRKTGKYTILLVLYFSFVGSMHHADAGLSTDTWVD